MCCLLVSFSPIDKLQIRLDISTYQSNVYANTEICVLVDFNLIDQFLVFLWLFGLFDNMKNKSITCLTL